MSLITSCKIHIINVFILHSSMVNNKYLTGYEEFVFRKSSILARKERMVVPGGNCYFNNTKRCVNTSSHKIRLNFQTLKISIPGPVIVFMVKAGKGRVDIFKRHIVLFAADSGAEMNCASLFKVKVDNRGTAKVAYLNTCQVLFAVNAGQACDLSLCKFNVALFVKTAIGGTKVEHALLAVHFNPQFNAWFGIQKNSVIHDGFPAMWTLYLQ